MLKRQSKRPEFTGGLESKQLKDWHVNELVKLKPTSLYFAYDEADDYEPLVRAVRMLQDAGITNYRTLKCYVLVGYPKDTIELAEQRVRDVIKLGMTPFAMLYRDEYGKTKKLWREFQRVWVVPAAIATRRKEILAGRGDDLTLSRK